ncbi:MAG: hypothetical protein AAF639_31780 [Chloroflexota bacterium]
MKFLHRIWADVRQGENIDLYLTVFVAILLVILNLLGVAPDSMLTPLTLAVLGLLAVTMLGNRYQFEHLVNRLTEQSTSFFSTDVADSFDTDLQNASEIWMVGVSLSRTIKSHYGLLETLLKRGVHVRVLLIDPESHESIAIATQREYHDRRFSQDRIRSMIRNTLQDLYALKEVAPTQMSIRLIQFPLAFGAVATDPNELTGVLHLEHYSYKMPGGSVPKFTLIAKDGQWYDFFRDELDTLWENGVDWPY